MCVYAVRMCFFLLLRRHRRRRILNNIISRKNTCNVSNFKQIYSILMVMFKHRVNEMILLSFEMVNNRIKLIGSERFASEI